MNIYRWPEVTTVTWSHPCFVIAIGESVEEARENAREAFYPYMRKWDCKLSQYHGVYIARWLKESDGKTLDDLSEEDRDEYYKQYATFNDRISEEPEVLDKKAVLIFGGEAFSD